MNERASNTTSFKEKLGFYIIAALVAILTCVVLVGADWACNGVPAWAESAWHEREVIAARQAVEEHQGELGLGTQRVLEKANTDDKMHSLKRSAVQRALFAKTQVRVFEKWMGHIGQGEITPAEDGVSLTSVDTNDDEGFTTEVIDEKEARKPSLLPDTSSKQSNVLSSMMEALHERGQEAMANALKKSAQEQRTYKWSLDEKQEAAFEHSSYMDNSFGTLAKTLYESGTSPNKREYLRNQSYIPDYHKQLFNEMGWQVVFTTDDLKEKMGRVLPESYEEEELVGLCQYGAKTIYLRSDFSSSAIVHEMGHFIDYMLGRPSAGNGDDGDFVQAWEADADEYEKYFPYTHLDEEAERWAEAYSTYYERPVMLKEHCPALYQYFAEHL